MPDRILKASICSSDDIDQLTPFEETVFYRLIVNCDDYGRLDARTSFLKSMLFITKKGVTEKNVEEAVLKLACIGLVRLYKVDGKPFLYFPKWDRHQRIRAKRSKYPSPDDACQHMTANDDKCVRNPIQSESESNAESESIVHGVETPCSTMPPVFSLPLNDKSEYSIYQDDVDKWGELYPAVDVSQELRKMRGWIEANPTKRKTKTGILKFINGWLARTQDKGGSGPPKQSSSFDGFQALYDKYAEEDGYDQTGNG